MEITKGSDLILILKLEDFKDEKLRVADCADFRLKVWSANPNNYLEFTKGDIIKEEKIDKISIPDFMINCLESGVICYMAIYSKIDNNFDRSDNQYHKTRTYITDIYWRNCNLNEEPKNPVNYQTLNWLINKIENNRLDCESANAELKEFVNKDFMEKLNAEIKRSNEVDIEFHKMIKQNQSEAQQASNELSEKLDAEIKNSEETKEELKNTKDKLTEEITRSFNEDTKLNTKIEGEIERAKTAEGAIRDAVEIERDRAIAKESIINDTIEHLNTELHEEIDRAKEAEKNLEEYVGGVITDVENVNGALGKLEDTVEDLQKSLEEEITNSNEKDDELEAELNELGDEIETMSKAMIGFDAAIATHSTAIEMINGDETVIGSIKHSYEDSKHYTDDELNKLKSTVNATLQDYSTKTDVDNRIKDVIGTAPEALDTLGEIANVLSGNGDAIEAINGVLSGKTNADDVYSKNEIDTKITAVNNSISTVETDLTNETNRAKAAEKLNADSIAIINGDDTVIGSIKHALEDAKHYTDDKINNIAFDDVDLSDYYTKEEVDAELVNKQKKLIAGTNISLSDNGEISASIPTVDMSNYVTTPTLYNYATKDYVSNAITDAIVDVPIVNLAPYATKEELNEAIDNIEIPTVDTTKLNSLANEWFGNQSQYDAIEKDNNTIYYITE